MKKTLSFIFGIAVSAAILFYLCKDLDWSLMFEQLTRIKLVYFIPIIFIIWLSYLIRALRWKYLLPENEAPDSSTLYNATAAGMLAIMVVPLRAGEFFRPWAISRNKQISFSTSLASILLERVFDVLLVLILLAFCLPKIPNPPELVEKGGIALGVLAGAIIIFIIFCFVSENFIRKSVSYFLNFLLSNYESLQNKISNLFEDFLKGLKAIGSIKRVAIVFSYSVVLWLCFLFLYQCFIWSFGIEADLWLGALVTVMIALAIAAPSAPGFVGTFQAGCVIAMTTIYGLDKELSIAYSLIAHFIQMLAAVCFGMYSLKKLGLSVASLKGDSKVKEVGI